jgi:hypothetical protein
MPFTEQSSHAGPKRYEAALVEFCLADDQQLSVEIDVAEL